VPEWLYVLTPPRQTFREDATPKESAAMRDHFTYLEGLLAERKLVLAGPSLQPLFGIVVVEAPDEDAAQALMKADPAVSRGVQSAELHPFRLALLRT
jgi:uncharacterized protein YciI